MRGSLGRYRTFVFDCDGVVLNSNSIKSRAFYEAAKPYGDLAAQALLDYHLENGGVSRYKKFTHFVTTIHPKLGQTPKQPNLEDLLKTYGQTVRQELENCPVTPGLMSLRERFPQTRWLMVSGADQEELRDILFKRRIYNLFDGGIFGSPDSKITILGRELENRNIVAPTIFFGDSRYDYDAASHFGIDFTFISDWTEFSGWEKWVIQENVAWAPSISYIANIKT